MSAQAELKSGNWRAFKETTRPLRIQFIMPPTSKERLFGRFKELGSRFPPLGLAGIAAIAEMKGHAIKVTDAVAMSLSLEDVGRAVREFSPHLVGMPTLAININMCHALARTVKEISPACKVILGGPYVSLFVEHALKPRYVDFGILGEGEVVFEKFLDALDENRGFSDIPGLAYKDDAGKIHVNPKPPVYLALDRFPSAARHHFPFDKYYSSAFLRGKRTLNIISSRGCPYRCAYCSSPQIFGRSFRHLSTARVMDEIHELIHIYGADSLQFYDETFTGNRKQVMELCDAIIAEKLNVPWTCFTRANLVDTELLQKMRQAGCYLIFFGLESGVQRLLDLIQKDLTLEQSREAIRLCKDTGIQSECSFMLGLPSETKAESWETINFALELEPEYAQFLAFWPWQGTALYDIAKMYGVITNEKSRDHSHWDTAYAPRPDREPAEVQATVREAYKKFYLRPGYLLRGLYDAMTNLPPEKIWRLMKAAYVAFGAEHWASPATSEAEKSSRIALQTARTDNHFGK